MSVRYYHGGPKVDGTHILPPSVTGAARVMHGEHYVCVTTEYTLALTYAATCDGWVYEVAPDGPVVRDPDSMLDTSLRCPSARIVRRIRPPKRTLEAARAAVARGAALMGGAR